MGLFQPCIYKRPRGGWALLVRGEVELIILAPSLLLTWPNRNWPGKKTLLNYKLTPLLGEKGKHVAILSIEEGGGHFGPF